MLSCRRSFLKREGPSRATFHARCWISFLHFPRFFFHFYEAASDKTLHISPPFSPSDREITPIESSGKVVFQLRPCGRYSSIYWFLTSRSENFSRAMFFLPFFLVPIRSQTLFPANFRFPAPFYDSSSVLPFPFRTKGISFHASSPSLTGRFRPELTCAGLICSRL